jgi:protoporphyrinogen/coproporphyrinogen III oxidase
VSGVRAFDVVVLGAGVSGLVTAAGLQRAGVSTLLIEERATVGGLLASSRLGDHDIDAGAESFATRNTAVVDLLTDLGVDLTIASPNSAGATILSMRSRRPRRTPLPRETVLGIPGRPVARDVRRAVGILGAVRACVDGLLPRGFGADSLSLGALVERRMGRRVRTALVDTVCRSVYSTASGDVDVDKVAPRLRSEMARVGSLAGAVRSLSSGARPGSAVASMIGGMWQLPERLVRSFTAEGGTVVTRTRVTSISKNADGGFSVPSQSQGSDDEVTARHLVIATDGPTAGALLERISPRLSELLSTVTFGGVTIASVRLTSAELDSFPVGTGVIVAKGVGTAAKALTHLNAKWAWFNERMTAHEHIVRLSFDGVAPLMAMSASDRTVVAAEVSALMGVAVAASDISAITVSQWANAVVPLATATRADLEAAAVSAERSGITCVGSWVSGTGLAAVIPHARSAADRIIQSLEIQLKPAEKESQK